MTIEQSVTLTCPSCSFSSKIPSEKIPANAVKVTCGKCGHSFPLTEQSTSMPSTPMDFIFNNGLPPTTAADKKPEVLRKETSFVTTLAWIFIILSGFSTLISILQNVMINTLFPIEEMQRTVSNPGVQKMPTFFQFMMGNFRLFFASFLVVTSATLCSSIGLLKRKNWARLVFIIILSLGIVWNIAGIFLQFFTMNDFPGPQVGNAEFHKTFNTMRNVIMVFTAIFSIGMSVLFGWLIRKLCSPQIRGEFL